MAAAAKGTILVTGASGGLGSAIAQQVASKPELSTHYYGLYTARDAAAAPALTWALSRGSSSHLHEVASLELTSFDSVRQFARDINVGSPCVPPHTSHQDLCARHNDDG